VPSEDPRTYTFRTFPGLKKLFSTKTDRPDMLYKVYGIDDI